jgi:hypothetical protein
MARYLLKAKFGLTYLVACKTGWFLWTPNRKFKDEKHLLLSFRFSHGDGVRAAQ